MMTLPALNGGEPVPQGSTPSSRLREVVEAALEVSFLATQGGRDAVLLLLRPDLASAIPRMPTARMDTMSMVVTCARYPDGLNELVEAIRFYAAGTTAMVRLDTAIAHLSPSPQEGTLS
jgi:hypothetical protein